MSYRTELDGVRAIAVGAVILAHAGAPLAGGHLGVDIFFVLSGYLITGQIVRELARGTFSLRDFYIRRARRLLPALAVVCCACLPAAWLLMPPDALQRFGQSLVALGAFATNIFFWRQGGYFGPQAGETVLIHTWSLAVEEQFYLLFPLCLLMLWPRGRVRMIRVLAGAGVLSLVAMLAMTARDANGAFYLLPFRVWELLAGALIALAPRVAGQQVWHAHAAIAGIGLIGLGLLLGAPGGLLGPATQVAVVAGTALVLLGAGPHNRTGRWLGVPVLRGLGLISYSAYLWHQPLFAFGRLSQLDAPEPRQMFALTGLTLALAWLTWRFVEQPCRKQKWNLGQIMLGGAAGATLVVAGLALHLGQGFGPTRFSPGQLALYQTATPSPLRAQCHAGGEGSANGCVYFIETPPRWAVLGDSHAVEIAHELARALGTRGESLLHLSASACPPAIGPAPLNAPCANWLDRALARIDAQPEIETVVLAYRHSIYLHGENQAGHQTAPDATFNLGDKGTATERRMRYWVSLNELVARLGATGREVVLLAPVPEIRRDMAKYALFAADAAQDLPAITHAAYRERNAFMLSRIGDLPVRVISPDAALCSAGWCYAARDGEALYFDDDHLSLAGARRVVDLLLQSSELAQR